MILDVLGGLIHRCRKRQGSGHLIYVRGLEVGGGGFIQQVLRKSLRGAVGYLLRGVDVVIFQQFLLPGSGLFDGQARGIDSQADWLLHGGAGGLIRTGA